jgi:multicomponent Na+:H+ antiporter subunit G
MLETALDVVAGACLIAGALLAFTAGIGLLRFRDVLARTHAATKPQVLGLLLILAGAGIRLRSSVDLWMIVLAAGFQLMTAPVSAHFVGGLAYRSRHVCRDALVHDDLAAAADVRSRPLRTRSGRRRGT